MAEAEEKGQVYQGKDLLSLLRKSTTTVRLFSSDGCLQSSQIRVRVIKY